MTYNGLSATTNSAGFYSISTPTPSSGGVKAAVPSMLSNVTTISAEDGLSANADVWAAAAGVLTGRVTHTSGVPISGAIVTAFGGVLGFSRSVKTDINGYYNFGYVAVGAYTLTASASGASTRASASVAGGATTAKNLQLP